jgi:hypothetical protein
MAGVSDGTFAPLIRSQSMIAISAKNAGCNQAKAFS